MGTTHLNAWVLEFMIVSSEMKYSVIYISKFIILFIPESTESFISSWRITIRNMFCSKLVFKINCDLVYFRFFWPPKRISIRFGGRRRRKYTFFQYVCCLCCVHCMLSGDWCCQHILYLQDNFRNITPIDTKVGLEYDNGKISQN